MDIRTIIRPIKKHSDAKLNSCSFSIQSFVKLEDVLDGRQDPDAGGAGHSEEITKALLKEVMLLKWRETILRDFKVR